MFRSTRFKLVFSFLIVSFLVGGISLFIGGQLLYNAVLREATNQVRLALGAADDVYRTNIKYVKVALNITTLGKGFRSSFIDRDIPDLIDRLDRVSRNAELDFAGIVTSSNTTLCRTGPNSIPKENEQPENPITRYVITHQRPASGTVVLTKAFIARENPDHSDRIQFYPIQIDAQNETAKDEQQACMAIVVAIPIFEHRTTGELLGVLYGGIILNHSTDIVDSARKSVFFDEIHQEISMPTATIFFNTIRIATNMINENGLRAVGTRVSEAVKQEVLVRGKRWTQTHFYLTDRYIAAYEPITDIFGKRVGMLSIAILESNYSIVQRKIILLFIIATCIGALIAVGMGFFLAHRIMAPVHRLIKASREVSEGSLFPDIGSISNDQEIAILQKTFKDMVESMKRRRMASQSQILQSEKQASVGRLAAGVAHEINNPLTGVLTYTHMLLKREDIPDEIRSDLQVIAKSTDRIRKIVKGLLDFSRQTKLDPEPTDINQLVDATIKLVENQALLKGVSIHFKHGENLPIIVLDQSQIQSVLLNIMINALDATKPSDEITINSSMDFSASDTEHRGVEISIEDTGCGMPPEHLARIFDPFFSTKEVGKGTGLGLSVSFGIVKEHGGNLRVQSELGKGTKFFIWLPIEKQVNQNANFSRG